MLKMSKVWFSNIRIRGSLTEGWLFNRHPASGDRVQKISLIEYKLRRGTWRPTSVGQKEIASRCESYSELYRDLFTFSHPRILGGRRGRWFRDAWIGAGQWLRDPAIIRAHSARGSILYFLDRRSRRNFGIPDAGERGIHSRYGAFHLHCIRLCVPRCSFTSSRREREGNARAVYRMNRKYEL